MKTFFFFLPFLLTAVYIIRIQIRSYWKICDAKLEKSVVQSEKKKFFKKSFFAMFLCLITTIFIGLLNKFVFWNRQTELDLYVTLQPSKLTDTVLDLSAVALRLRSVTTTMDCQFLSPQKSDKQKLLLRITKTAKPQTN